METEYEENPDEESPSGPPLTAKDSKSEYSIDDAIEEINKTEQEEN